MQLRCATFNVLADAYLDHGNYDFVDPGLLMPRARLPYLLQTITGLDADLIGMQEVETWLLNALVATKEWQVFWTPKDGGKPDGCLMLVKRNVEVIDFKPISYGDGSNHVMQSMVIDGITFVNTHIKWGMEYRVGQANMLLAELGDGPAVILADSNDRPGEPVHELIEKAGFSNVWGDEPTALIGSERAPIDLLAVRGVHANRIGTLWPLDGIPSMQYPSDHSPVMASVETD
jgi:endonuclease/exonuclease/phosphatase family metal-dependent hydrolase